MNIKLRIKLSLAVLLISVTAWAQVGTIKGSVTTSDGKPAEYVNIALKGTGKGAVSDKEGKFEINSVKAGQYVLIASHVGASKQEQTIEVKQGETTEVKLILNESSTELSEISVVDAKTN